MTTFNTKPIESKRGSRIKDARGRSITQLDPVRLCVWHRHDVIEADALERIVDELEPGTAKRRRRIILIAPCTIVLVGVGIAALYYFYDSGARRDLVSTLTNPAIMVPNVLCCIFVTWIAARQGRLKRVRFAMLKHRRCPHCGYNLHGLPTAPEDAATVCPECGCAWLIDDTELAERLAATATPATATGTQKKVLLLVALLLGVMAFAGLAVFAALR